MAQFAATPARRGSSWNIPVNGPTRSWAMARTVETMPLFAFALRTTSRMPTAMIAATTQATERTMLASESAAEASRAARVRSPNDAVSVSRLAERAPVPAARSSCPRPEAGAALEVATSSSSSRFPASRGTNACLRQPGSRGLESARRISASRVKAEPFTKSWYVTPSQPSAPLLHGTEGAFCREDVHHSPCCTPRCQSGRPDLNRRPFGPTGAADAVDASLSVPSVPTVPGYVRRLP